MIEIHPMADRDREKELLAEIPQKENNAKILFLTESGKEIGYVAVDILKGSLRMLKFKILDVMDDAEKDFYLDTLMRSAASYGEENGADKLETVSSEMNKLLSLKGFDTDETHAYTNMSTIVHYDY